MIEMGVVTNETEGSLTAITHVAGVPDDCGQVVGAWVASPAGYWIQDPSTDIDPPSGGLFGSALMIDLLDGTSASYNADAIDAFITGDQNLHNVPGEVNPSLSSVGGVDPSVTAYVFNNGNLIQATYGSAVAPGSRNVDSVSALFMHDNIYNEYVLGGIAAAVTEWVVTFPTKRYYVDKIIVGPGVNALPPFARTFNGTANVEVGLFPFDREEASPGSCTGSDADNPNCGVCFSPCDETTFAPPVLSYETQIITFRPAADFDADSTSQVLGSALASNVDVQADNLSEGWMRLALNPSTQPHALAASSDGEVFYGLPATGFAIQNFQNANVTPGKLANYSGLWKHKGSRNCEVPDPTAPLACS